MNRGIENILVLTEKIVKDYYLCKSCLGRLFGGLSKGLTNRERGEILLQTLKMNSHYKLLSYKRIPRKLLEKLIFEYRFSELKKIAREQGINIKNRTNEGKKCYICNGLMDNINEITNRIIDKIQDIEFERFIIGIKRSKRIEEKEEEIKRKFNIWFGENIRNELSRELGKRILDKLNRNIIYEPKNPELLITIDIENMKIKIMIKPVRTTILISKLDKNAPIFSRVCTNCKGKGCATCEYTGKQVGNSLEYNLGKSLLKIYGGKRWRFGMKYLDKNKAILETSFKIVDPKRRNIGKEEIINLNKLLESLGFKIIDITRT